MRNRRVERSWELRRFLLNNLPIRYKLIVHFLLISILPSIGLGLLTNWTVDLIIERQITDTTLQLIGKVKNATPGMVIATMAHGIEAAIEAAVSTETDATDIMGETH